MQIAQKSITVLKRVSPHTTELPGLYATWFDALAEPFQYQQLV